MKVIEALALKKRLIISGFLILASLLLFLSSSIAYAELTPPIPGAPAYIDIGVEKAHQMLDGSPEQIILLDVRTEGEYNAENIPGAINIPLSELETRIGELDESKAIIVYCRTGDISGEASEILVQHGFELVYNMPGGIDAWRVKFATSVSTPMPAETPILTPTVTPSPAVSPALTPAASSSPTTLPTPEEVRRIPGFEAPLAIMMIFFLFILKRRRR